MSQTVLSVETLAHAAIDRLIATAAMHPSQAPTQKPALAEWMAEKFSTLPEDAALAEQRNHIAAWLERTAAECEGSARLALDAAAFLLRQGLPL